MTEKDMNVMEALAPPHPHGPSPRSPHLVPRLAPLGKAGLGPFVLFLCLAPSLSHARPPHPVHRPFPLQSAPQGVGSFTPFRQIQPTVGRRCAGPTPPTFCAKPNQS